MLRLTVETVAIVLAALLIGRAVVAVAPYQWVGVEMDRHARPAQGDAAVMQAEWDELRKMAERYPAKEE